MPLTPFTHHALHLPLAYDQVRRVGQTVARIRELETIRQFLTSNALLVIDLAFTVIFFAVMLAYSPKLTLIVALSVPVFAAIGDGSAMTQKALAAQAVVEQPTMAATLSRMVRDGLVARLPNPKDARSALVSLTPPALAKVKDLDAAIAEVNRVATATLTKAERTEYLRLIGKIISALEAANIVETV